MSNEHEKITDTNVDAQKQFDGGKDRPLKPMKESDGTQEVNDAADAEFNRDAEGDVLGNHVGGLRGPSD
jgi:hypothetical protein